MNNTYPQEEKGWLRSIQDRQPEMKTDQLEKASAPHQKNHRKYSPIPWLALHIALFNRCDSKTALAKARATLADRLYALSVQDRRRA